MLNGQCFDILQSHGFKPCPVCQHYAYGHQHDGQEPFVSTHDGCYHHPACTAPKGMASVGALRWDHAVNKRRIAAGAPHLQAHVGIHGGGHWGGGGGGGGWHGGGGGGWRGGRWGGPWGGWDGGGAYYPYWLQFMLNPPVQVVATPSYASGYETAVEEVPFVLDERSNLYVATYRPRVPGMRLRTVRGMYADLLYLGLDGSTLFPNAYAQGPLNVVQAYIDPSTGLPTVGLPVNSTLQVLGSAHTGGPPSVEITVLVPRGVVV